ncbi:MAG: threonine synthase [Ruminococcaceae bacterium]|nr:threonine synthase [Oscillospiraceae bacterium]
MNYSSTRCTNNQERVSAAQAIKQGLANDGGLFMPDSIPSLSLSDIENLIDKSYIERAAEILSLFLTDYTKEELLEDCKAAYSEERFVGGAAPLKSIDGKVFSLELWHGPTCAFKDMALQIMPRLLCRALEKTGEKRDAMILVATSGDTGKAALEGYRDIDKIRIKVFYPVDGVSRVQKLQMATQIGKNVDVCAIHGNFDDAQTGVKKIFADAKIAKDLNDKGIFLSSANSINWGRLAPQIVYYVSAYCDMVKMSEIKLGEKIDVCVPTGNFGNIFAAYIAKMMGLPIEKFVCASNKNNILTDFLATGTYDRNRKFYTTMSPSMDILISSNLERLLYTLAGAEKTAAYMKELNTTGKYTLDAETKAKIDENFYGYCCDEEDTAKTIRETFDKYGYLCDTHTAVGLSCARQYAAEHSTNKIVLASTASPYKFANDVFSAVSGKTATDELSALTELSAYTGTDIPAPLAEIDKREIRFTKTINATDMPADVMSFAD